MTLSRIENRGTLTGRLQRTSGGGGGVTDYGDLTGKPKINGTTVNGDKDGHDYNLANLSDIPVIPPSPPSYAMNVHDDDYYTEDLNWIMSNNIQKQWKVYSSKFKYPTAASDGEKGLVPKAFAGDQDKILSASGWVANKMNKDFYTAETDTGLYWIDGRKIYCKCYQQSINSSNLVTVDSSLNNAIANMLPMSCICLKSNGTAKAWYLQNVSTTAFLRLLLDNDGVKVGMLGYQSANQGTAVIYAVLYYTKIS